MSLHATLGSDGILCFLHIPKTGGSTLFQLLSNQFLFEQVAQRPSDASISQRMNASMVVPFDLSGKRVMRAHADYRLREYIEQPLTYVTILRNPVDRVISLWRYIMGTPHNGQHKEAREMSFFEFLDWQWGNYQCHNDMVRRLTGTLINQPYPNFYRDNKIPIGDAGAQCAALAGEIESALGNLADMFWFGLLEDLDESLFMLNRKTGWQLGNTYRINSSPRRPIPDGAHDAIAARNAADMAFYESACKIHEGRKNGRDY